MTFLVSSAIVGQGKISRGFTRNFRTFEQRVFRDLTYLSSKLERKHGQTVSLVARRTGQNVPRDPAHRSRRFPQASALLEDESIHLIRSAIDGGIAFMGNSWDYNQGRSELRMGKSLEDGYRQKVFLMSKLDGRTKEEATKLY